MISVCMAAYNGEQYILAQLESILRQLGPDDEVVISDDGSKDRTKEIIESIHDSRIHYIVNQGKHGFTRNFENALRHARGDYIFLSDQDDIWLENKVSIVMDALQSADFVTHDCITGNNEFQILSESRFQDFHIKAGFLRHLIKSRYLGCCMAFRRSLLDAALPFPKDDSLVEHDIWLAALAFLYFRVTLIHSPLIYYRRHGNNASDGGFSDGYSMPVKIRRRLYRCWNLLLRYPSVKKVKRCKR